MFPAPLPPPPPGPQPAVETVDSHTARLTWTPATAGQFSVGIMAMDESDNEWTQRLIITVAG